MQLVSVGSWHQAHNILILSVWLTYLCGFVIGFQFDVYDFFCRFVVDCRGLVNLLWKSTTKKFLIAAKTLADGKSVSHAT